MSINVNDKNLGHATAYAYYKAGGGTMTEAEFTEFMADFGTASQTAVEAAQAALASKNAAQTAANTATTKASEATTAATTATTKAAEASTSASTATSAKDTAVSASQTATTKATEATTSAATATSAKTDAVAANTAAQSAKTAAQTAQTGAETAAASVQASAAQIQTNADDISELKEDLSQIGLVADYTSDKWGSLDGQAINTSGVADVSANYKATPFISVSQGDIVYYSLYSSSTINALSFYTSTSESDYVEGINTARASDPLAEYIVPSDGYIRGCCNLNNIASPILIIVTGFIAALTNNVNNFISQYNEKYNSGLYGTLNFHNEEDTVIQKVLADKDANTITIGVITDTHYSKLLTHRSRNQAIAINALCERVGASFIVHLGDIIEGSESTKALNQFYLSEYWAAQHQTFVPILYTVAHHEQYGPLGPSYWGNDPNAISQSECVGVYGLTNKYLNITYSSDKSNWYVDICGVRFIGLNSASRNGTGGSPTSFSVDVLDFLSSALANCTLPVIVLSHAAASAVVNYRATYTQNGDDATIGTYGDGRKSVVTQLNEYSHGVMAYIHGHTHWDNIAKPSDCDFSYISIINAHASNVDAQTNGVDRGVIGSPVSYKRPLGTYQEYGFDIINIHPDTNTINLFRFGVGSDRTLVN